MTARVRHWTVSALAAVVASGTVIDAQKGPALPDLLQAAADYLARYSETLSAVAAEEVCLQYDVSSGSIRGTARLTSDVVLAGLSDGFESFRDVAAIDNAPLRARDDRLAARLTELTPAALEQARAWSAESVNRYISPNLHALDQPMAALQFLRKEHQARSSFTLESVKTTGGVQVAVVRFSERGIPRLIAVSGDGAATGRFWVEVASGVVRQTEIGISNKAFSTRATVKYALDPAIGLWLPVEMIQQFDGSGPGSSPINYMGANGGYNARQSLEGRAKYSKFRHVNAAAKQ